MTARLFQNCGAGVGFARELQAVLTDKRLELSSVRPNLKFFLHFSLVNPSKIATKQAGKRRPAAVGKLRVRNEQETGVEPATFTLAKPPGSF